MREVLIQKAGFCFNLDICATLSQYEICQSHSTSMFPKRLQVLFADSPTMNSDHSSSSPQPERTLAAAYDP